MTKKKKKEILHYDKIFFFHIINFNIFSFSLILFFILLRVPVENTVAVVLAAAAVVTVI